MSEQRNDHGGASEAALFETEHIRFPSPVHAAVGWNWHSQIEWCFVDEGSADCLAGGQRMTLRRGECVAVNAGILHSYAPTDRQNPASLTLVRYSPALLAEEGTKIYDDTIRPFIECRALAAVVLRDEAGWQRTALRIARNICLTDRTAFAWELGLRGQLCALTVVIIRALKDRCHESDDANKLKINDNRARLMLSFIQSHYHEDLTIDAIAAAASISRSECFRCFRLAMNIRPIEYLTALRVERAIDLLLNTGRSVTDICSACGFSDISYFGKVFHAATGFPPRTFRQKFASQFDSSVSEPVFI